MCACAYKHVLCVHVCWHVCSFAYINGHLAHEWSLLSPRFIMPVLVAYMGNAWRGEVSGPVLYGWIMCAHCTCSLITVCVHVYERACLHTFLWQLSVCWYCSWELVLFFPVHFSPNCHGVHAYRPSVAVTSRQFTLDVERLYDTQVEFTDTHPVGEISCQHPYS